MSVDIQRVTLLEAENQALRRRVAAIEGLLTAFTPSTPYAALFDQLPVPMVIYNTDGVAVAINRHNEQLIGVRREAIVGHHNIFADPQAHEMGYLNYFLQALAGRVVTMPPTAYDTAKAGLDAREDDRQIWSETTYFPIYNDVGNVVQIGEINLDVTERMRSAQQEQRLAAALQEYEQRFSALFEGASIGAALIRLDGRLLETNRALQTMLGYPADTLRTMAVAQLLHPNEQTHATQLFRALASGVRDSFQLEQRYLRSDQAVRLGRLTCTLVRDTHGTAAFAIGMVEDITAQRAAEDARRVSETLLQAILEQLPLAVYAKDASGNYILANRRAAELVGLPATDMVGRTDYELFPQPVAAEYAALDQEVFRTGAIIEREQGFDLHSQSLVVATTKFPLLDLAGHCYAVCGISGDITARKRAEAERLEFERNMLESQKLESLGLLAGGVAHDFNNLVVVMLGNAALVLEELPPDAAAREAVAQIQVAARRAADLTRQMLAYAGKAQLEAQPVQLNALVEETVQLLRVAIPQKITVCRHLKAVLPTIQGDATQLRQVLLNLLVNAAESIGSVSGVITITSEMCEVDAHTLNTRYRAADAVAGWYVTLTVQDSGAGIEPATLARIFEPFFSTKFTGRGLGLAAVMGIIRSHRGAIHVASTPGEGSTFTVLLPASSEGGVAQDEGRAWH